MKEKDYKEWGVMTLNGTLMDLVEPLFLALYTSNTCLYSDNVRENIIGETS